MLLTFTKSKDQVFRSADTLDAAWAEAEELGRVELKMPIVLGASPRYEAEISFRRASGTLVYAKGKSNDRIEALRLAIIEAVELGAKP